MWGFFNISILIAISRKKIRYIGWDNELNQSKNKKTEIFRQLVLVVIKVFLCRKIKCQIHKRNQIYSTITLVTILLSRCQILHRPMGITQAEVRYLDLRNTEVY